MEDLGHARATERLAARGLALKLNQIKLAMRSYLRDRANQATGTVASYAIASGLFAAAGIFLIAACLVGVTALFRWIEIKYGLFWAFGAVGALLLLLAVIFAGLAREQAEAPASAFPEPDQPPACRRQGQPAEIGSVDAASDTAAVLLRAPSAPATRANRRRLKNKVRYGRNSPERPRRSDFGGDVTGLGGDKATSAGAPDGKPDGRPALAAVR